MAVTISHSHADGTIVSGTARGDGSRDVLRSFGLRWSRSLGAWFIPQSRDRAARTGPRGLEMLRDALQGAGFEIELEIDDERRSTAEVQAARLERAGSRAEHLDGRAARLAQTAEGEFEKSHAATAGIPFGQPILVGHHSQRRHERAIERSHAAADRGLAAHREAEGAAHGAAAARATIARQDSPTYIGNRIEEAERDLRAAERGHALIDGGYTGPLPERVAEATDRLGFWRGELERVQAAGVKVYGKADIEKGGAIKSRGRWSKVVRASAKSVSVETGYSWTDRVPYTEIRDYRSPAQLAQATAGEES